jgi:hypothetical protein
MLGNYDSDMETVDFISMRESSVCLKKKLVKPSNVNKTSIFYDELNDKSNDKQKNNEKNNGFFSFCNII